MKRRPKLFVVALAIATIALAGAGLWVASAARSTRVSVFGGGRIGDPIPGITIPSASDFGFAVDASGGPFVCSTAGPETGGFFGFQVNTVEGVVTPGSLRVHGRDITFSGKVTVVLIPGLEGASHSVLDNLDFTVTARAGGEGRGQMILNIPAFASFLGGNTGGIIAKGKIKIGGPE
ncbi:MAG: hypothetical protein L0220_10460 [Acidobacteria bacterium]|nr:hypothetical protein [Acidobacteriota bacterium]